MDNELDNDIQCDKEPVSSSVCGDQGIEEKEEVSVKIEQSDDNEQQQQPIEIIPECSSGGDSDEQSDGKLYKSPELQYDGCGCRCDRCKLESTRKLWEFIDRQQSAWDWLQSQTEGKLIENKGKKNKRKNKKKRYHKKSDDIVIFDIFMIPPSYTTFKKNNKGGKKKWFKKKF